jgi:hypothetical protein
MADVRVYLFADVTFGTLACLTRSIRPGIVVHAAGIFIFFAFVWPHDVARPVPAADARFYPHVAQVLIFGAAAVAAFRRLAQVAKNGRAGPQA